MSIFNLNVIICISILLIVNLLLSKKKILIDNPLMSDHKDDHNKIIPLSGGIFFIISYIILSIVNNVQLDNFIFVVPLLFLGIIADIKENFSPKMRLLIQLFFIILLVYFSNVIIVSIDLNFFDHLLKMKLFNYFFVIFCIITVLNGHNLMDGLNGFVSGNFLLILLSIMAIISYNELIFDINFNKKLNILFVICSIFFIFNFFGKCFLGDNGIYVFSIIISLLVINFVYLSNNQVSPLIAASFLWYPAYENLFSILRRLKNRKVISKPDKLHLHVLLKNFLKIKYGERINSRYINSLSGILMNIILLPNFILSVYWYNSSNKILTLIIFELIIYMIIYAKLLKKNLQ